MRARFNRKIRRVLWPEQEPELVDAGRAGEIVIARGRLFVAALLALPGIITWIRTPTALQGPIGIALALVATGVGFPLLRRAHRDEGGTAAIAARAAAEIYGLGLLANDIEDRPDNTTRFLVVGRKLFSACGSDKTTLLVSGSATVESGALFRLLEPLAKHKVNMTRIESRPSRKRKWDYVFFIDIEGHISDKAVARALGALERRASLFKVLGSYPRAIL